MTAASQISTGVSHDARWQELRREIIAACAGPELLSMVLGFQGCEEVALTRDGLLVGRRRGRETFEALLGPVTPAMCRRTRRLWQELGAAHRAMLLDRLHEQCIDPSAIGIPAREAPPRRAGT
jgi:hypothetical protein